MTLSEYVREGRLNKGFTQESFAEELGVSKQSIYLIEKNNKCGLTLLIKLSEFFNVEISFLRSLEHEDNK